MSNSVKVRLKKDYKGAVSRKDGTNAVYLHVTVGTEAKKIPLNIYWPLFNFDEAGGQCLPRHKNDKDCSDYNLMIRDEIGKINEIFKYYRLSRKVLTMEKLLFEYSNPYSKTDFIRYFASKLEERYADQEIKKRTYYNHLSTLNKLKDYKKQILFHHLDVKLVKGFDNHLKKKFKSEQNTRWGRHRDIKTYLEFARKDDVLFTDPYKDFSVTPEAGKWKPLPLTTLQKLDTYYKECKPGTVHRRVLQKFLAGCFSSLRVSDQSAITPDNLIGDTLFFVPVKGSKSKKQLRLPLPKQALGYIQDSIRENDAATIFYNYTDQFSNRILKDIATHLEIKEKLHHHVARETYATNFIASGGNVVVLKELLGHYNISHTMKYVHVNEQLKKDQLKPMDKLLQ